LVDISQPAGLAFRPVDAAMCAATAQAKGIRSSFIKARRPRTSIQSPLDGIQAKSFDDLRRPFYPSVAAVFHLPARAALSSNFAPHIIRQICIVRSCQCFSFGPCSAVSAFTIRQSSLSFQPSTQNAAAVSKRDLAHAAAGTICSLSPSFHTARANLSHQLTNLECTSRYNDKRIFLEATRSASGQAITVRLPSASPPRKHHFPSFAVAMRSSSMQRCRLWEDVEGSIVFLAR
jgi:hypothetical protein